MYEFRSVTPRIERLREKVRNRVIIFDAERGRIITEAYKKTENIIPIIRRPMVLKEICEKMTLLVEDDELFFFF